MLPPASSEIDLGIAGIDSRATLKIMNNNLELFQALRRSLVKNNTATLAAIRLDLANICLDEAAGQSA